jgi:hypothetical protein
MATARLSAITRVGAHGVELVVEGDDLGPVGCCGGGGVGVGGGDGRLDLERAGLVAAQAGAHEGVSFGDEYAFPLRAVLVGQADHRSVDGGSCRPPGFGEQHEGEEADGFGLVGHELGEHAPEADGFTREVDAGEAVAGGRGVPFGVDEVDRAAVPDQTDRACGRRDGHLARLRIR